MIGLRKCKMGVGRFPNSLVHEVFLQSNLAIANLRLRLQSHLFLADGRFSTRAVTHELCATACSRCLFEIAGCEHGESNCIARDDCDRIDSDC